MSGETRTARELAHEHVRPWLGCWRNSPDEDYRHNEECDAITVAITTARAAALEEAAELAEGEPYGESVHTIAARIRALKTP